MWGLAAISIGSISEGGAGNPFSASEKVALIARAGGASLASCPFGSWSNTESLLSSDSSHSVGAVTVAIIGGRTPHGGVIPPIFPTEVVPQNPVSSTDSGVNVGSDDARTVDSLSPQFMSTDFPYTTNDWVGWSLLI